MILNHFNSNSQENETTSNLDDDHSFEADLSLLEDVLYTTNPLEPQTNSFAQSSPTQATTAVRNGLLYLRGLDQSTISTMPSELEVTRSDIEYESFDSRTVEGIHFA